MQSDTRFVYDGWNLLVEIEMLTTAKDAPHGASGPYVRRSYVWGTDVSGYWQGAGGVGGLLVVRRHARGTLPMESYWATWDLNGNVIGLVSPTVPPRGTPPKMGLYEYDPFGNAVRISEPEEDLCPFRFSTKYQDAETGLYYYGYRYYDAVRGRWLNRDPIEEEGGINLYSLVQNNPITYIDINGLQTLPVYRM